MPGAIVTFLHDYALTSDVIAGSYENAAKNANGNLLVHAFSADAALTCIEQSQLLK